MILAAALRGPGPPPPAADPMEKWQAFFGEVRQAVSIDTFQADAASRLLERAGREFPRQKPLVDELVEGQHQVARSALENLPRERWLENREKAERLRAWLAFMKRDTAAADRILAYRGTCSILIQVHPYAELRGPLVSALPPQERCTPAALRDVEITDGEIEILHPEHGRHPIPVRGLKNGTSYVLEGTWDRKEDLKLVEGK